MLLSALSNLLTFLIPFLNFFYQNNDSFIFWSFYNIVNRQKKLHVIGLTNY